MNIPLPANLPYLIQWLDDPDVIIDGNDGDESGVGAEGVVEEVEDAVRADREVGDVEALLLQVAAVVEDALVMTSASSLGSW
ncbi:hypothetical protein MRB53_004189 [Persea americana]|uniref:Uncharacterized protein n=1 Tax=Persea americana TaxID=3435 RepID=A0ACC2MZR3_PERAE|nr:hypothetical protein MRB53_004189 [Persea americana]